MKLGCEPGHRLNHVYQLKEDCFYALWTRFLFLVLETGKQFTWTCYTLSYSNATIKGHGLEEVDIVKVYLTEIWMI